MIGKDINRVNLNRYIKENSITIVDLSKQIDYDYTSLFRVVNYDMKISSRLKSKLVDYFNTINHDNRSFVNER